MATEVECDQAELVGEASCRPAGSSTCGCPTSRGSTGPPGRRAGPIRVRAERCRAPPITVWIVAAATDGLLGGGHHEALLSRLRRPSAGRDVSVAIAAWPRTVSRLAAGLTVVSCSSGFSDRSRCNPNTASSGSAAGCNAACSRRCWCTHGPWCRPTGSSTSCGAASRRRTRGRASGRVWRGFGGPCRSEAGRRVGELAGHPPTRVSARGRAGADRRRSVRTAGPGAATRVAADEPWAGRRHAGPGTGAVAWARSAGIRRRAVRGRRGRPVGRAAADGYRGSLRDRPRPGRARDADRTAERFHRRAPVARSPPGPADARAVPLRPASRGTAGVPHLPRAPRSANSDSNRPPPCVRCRRRSCARPLELDWHSPPARRCSAWWGGRAWIPAAPGGDELRRSAERPCGRRREPSPTRDS